MQKRDSCTGNSKQAVVKLQNTIRLSIALLFLTILAHGQRKTQDSLGNFRAAEGKLSWQKTYTLVDKTLLQEKIAAEPFASGLDLLDFDTSTRTQPYRLLAEGLPEYARHDFRAFLSIDFFPGTFRVTVKQIIFPDFVEQVYYNGMRQNYSRGSLEHYLLRRDGSILRTRAGTQVLQTFDALFSGIFDPMGQ